MIRRCPVDCTASLNGWQGTPQDLWNHFADWLRTRVRKRRPAPRPVVFHHFYGSRKVARSRLFRRIIGLGSHCIRLVESLKLDCACAVQRETPENMAAGFDETLSPVRFGGKTYGIAAIFSDSCSNTA